MGKMAQKVYCSDIAQPSDYSKLERVVQALNGDS